MAEQTKKNNIIFMAGKEKALEKIFNSSNFGYLAVGYYANASDTNGFINPDSEENLLDNGFFEISTGQSTTYNRVPLSLHSIIDKDVANGKITAKFTAELDLDNIVEDIPINQIAIVDSSTVGDASTTFFAASVTEEFYKNEKLALVFVIEVTM